MCLVEVDSPREVEREEGMEMDSLNSIGSVQAPSVNPVLDQDLSLGSQVAEFREIALWFSRLGEKFTPAIVIRPFEDPSLPHFRALSVDARHRVLSSLRDTHQIWLESVHEIEANQSSDQKEEVENDASEQVRLVQSRALWRTLAKHGFRFPSDLFTSIGHQDVVEVYTADSLQVFRSLHFFKVCSYTLEQIYCIPWFDLYQRDASANQQSFELLARAITGELRGLVNEERDSHYVYESLPGHGLRTRIKPGVLCFFENEARELSGYLHSFRVVPGEQTWI